MSEEHLEERLEFRIKKLCKLIDKYHKDGSVLIFAQTTTYVDALYNILGEIYSAMLPAITHELNRNVAKTVIIRLPARQKKDYDCNFSIQYGY